jgi:DNA-binding response OmpR family regulator
MTATIFTLPKTGGKAAAALVVEPYLPHLLFILSTLSSLQFDVVVADTFKDAKTTLLSARPALIITDVRLREYNGLHLVHRGRAAWKDVPAIVTSAVDDPVLREETDRLQATYITLPIAGSELVAAICRTVLQAGPVLEPVRAPFERRMRERRIGPGQLVIERRHLERRRDPAQALRHVSGFSR